MESAAKRILLAEDEDAVALPLQDALTHAGYAVLRAQDGEQALQMSLLEKPDLIVMDIMLPKMSGLDAVQKLRQNVWGKSAEILMLTNRSDVETVSAAMHVGADRYLIKSDTPLDRMVSTIDKFFAAASQAKVAAAQQPQAPRPRRAAADPQKTNFLIVLLLTCLALSAALLWVASRSQGSLKLTPEVQQMIDAAMRTRK